MPDATKTSKPASVIDASPAGQTASADAAGPAPGKPRSLAADAWRDLRRNPFFVVSGLLILLILAISLWPGFFTGADPAKGDLRNHFLQKPSYSHVFQDDWFGYDGQGRSIYARVIYGARNSVTVGVCVTLAVTVIGSIFGMLAGYFGGFWDAVISRLTDVFFGVPFLLGTMVVMNSVTNRSVWTVVGALTLLGWTQITRVMRGAVITTKQSDYVVAAKALGASTRRILVRHILPNAAAPVIVVATIALGGYITAEATLSFLGMGLSDDAISWGGDISDASKQLRNNPHILFFPAGMLSLTVLAFIMLGDAVRDALDPKLR
ncbi:ABC transporter permease [Streptomyces sp. MZ04]|uniref:ABC transporter permease n=1 Tax=Streptomyces sp. MZ04 TaxID=2559236 RepID=UPI00107EA778|nr:ABC transporter permease [Streptomyces sp. MZ04]TGB01348.1 ABC transporter permease [Streptomyces sp. MZ04]